MLKRLRSRLPQLSPAARIGLGLASLVVALLLIIDLVFGIFPSPYLALAEQRSGAAKDVATQAVVLLEAGQETALDRTIALLIARDERVARIRVERRDGTTMLDRRASGLTESQARDPAGAYRVSLMSAAGNWGSVSVWYREPPDSARSLLLRTPLLPVMIAMGTICFVVFALYLRRVLSHLDPASVVPARIRQAFDVFSSGIIVVDRQARILLANERFPELAGLPPDAALTGTSLQQIPGFTEMLSGSAANHPWALAMDTGEALGGARMDIRRPDGSRRRLLVNSAPIDDGDGKVRGCLISFEDITPIVDLNEQLARSNAELLRSKQEVEQMNVELSRLAARDPVTGAFNRRALFENFEALFSAARRNDTPLCCIMSDIDHFKRFNDQYGHAAGDAVLRAVNQVLTDELREQDILARYGGEEFCIVLPGVELTIARQVAERLRAAVETKAGQCITDPRSLRITASFGVSVVTTDVHSPEHLIELADQALYAAKAGGRNCVVTANEMPAAA